MHTATRSAGTALREDAAEGSQQVFLCGIVDGLTDSLRRCLRGYHPDIDRSLDVVAGDAWQG